MAEAYRTCTFDGCSKRHASLGFCRGHYHQFSAGKELKELRPRRSPIGHSERMTCAVRDCPDMEYARRLCQRHSQQASSFRISPPQFVEWWNAVPGCMICGKDRPLTVDHDHSCCGNVKRTCGECNRGLLCRQCNAALGMLEGDPRRLQSALEYLARQHDGTYNSL